MIITLKTLLQQTFTIDIDENLTVKDLKNRVNDERGADFPSDSLNLIYSGAIMVDDKLIKDYKIDAKKFIVVMKKKEPAAAPTTASPSKSAATESGAAKAAESANSAKKETDPIVATRPSDPVATAAAAAVTASSAAGPVTTSAGSGGAESSIGAEHESLIQNMMELGYSRALVEKALRLSFFNPDVACEHLISERITEANMDQLESDSFALAGVADEYLNFSEGVQVPASSGGGGSAGRRTTASTNPENDPLQFLRAQPQFHQMRQQIQQNPSFLNTVLQQIGVNNPALLKLISENQNAFVEMINEPINNNNNNTNNNRNVSASGAASNISLPAVASATTTAAANPAESMEVVVQEESPRSGAAVNPLTANDDLLAATLTQQISDFGEDANVRQSSQESGQPQQILINLSESDRLAIARIREISGFSEIEVVEAYLACGKNEDMAADFLLDE